MLIRVVAISLMTSGAVSPAECSFHTMCVDNEPCQQKEFSVTYNHTGRDAQGQTAELSLPALDWIPIYKYDEPILVRGHLSQAEINERLYYFQGAGTGFMLSEVGERSILTIQARNGRIGRGDPNKMFLMVRTFIGSCG